MSFYSPACPLVSIAVIAKDEAGSIGSVLSRIFGVMQWYYPGGYEVFVVDGYSRDTTVSVASTFGARVFKVKGGKGKAIREALSYAQGKYALFIDADGSHLPEDIPRLIRSAADTGSDMVIVSRILGGSEEMGTDCLDGLLRLSGNLASTAAVNLRWGVHLTDIQNGFRIIRREVALGLGLREGSFAIEQEMVMKCLKGHKKIGEIPGLERRRLYGASKIVKRKEFWKYVRSFLRELI